jgi:hypothetical protein
MIAALHSSKEEGTKAFVNGGMVHGWDTIEAVYRSDLSRAKCGVSRHVPNLKYSYVIRDAWTRLNVLPAKIMQVTVSLTVLYCKNFRITAITNAIGYKNLSRQEA